MSTNAKTPLDWTQCSGSTYLSTPNTMKFSMTKKIVLYNDFSLNVWIIRTLIIQRSYCFLPTYIFMQNNRVWIHLMFTLVKWQLGCEAKHSLITFTFVLTVQAIRPCLVKFICPWNLKPIVLLIGRVWSCLIGFVNDRLS